MKFHGREYIESLCIAIAVALCLRFFVISAYRIPTGSMIPTLKIGDFIFAARLPYGLPIPFSDGSRLWASLPKRGDVVVFRYPGNEHVNYVKRVIGLPGDRISIKKHHLFVNETEASYAPEASVLIADLPNNELYTIEKESIADSSRDVLKSTDGTTGAFGPIIVPPGQFFVLGDNRDSSDDSRYWGSVPLKDLEGRVVLVWLSFDWQNRWGAERFPSIRWDRVFKGVR